MCGRFVREANSCSEITVEPLLRFHHDSKLNVPAEMITLNVRECLGSLKLASLDEPHKCVCVCVRVCVRVHVCVRRDGSRRTNSLKETHRKTKNLFAESTRKSFLSEMDFKSVSVVT